MNEYLKNLNKIEFVVTNACTGKCKHCSQGDHVRTGERIDPLVAADAVKKISAKYDIKTVLAFGGEPLLCSDATYAILSAAKEMNVRKIQLITNGYFTNNRDKMQEVAARLSECGVNDLLLSVDAFHQETIPLKTVKAFAKEAKTAGIPIRLQPAWLTSPTTINPYNLKTREILDSFSDLDIPESEGNVVFLEGNARIYLAEYFTDDKPENPYEEDPMDVRCISFSPNGDVLNGNIYKTDIMEIINNYIPSRREL